MPQLKLRHTREYQPALVEEIDVTFDYYLVDSSHRSSTPNRSACRRRHRVLFEPFRLKGKNVEVARSPRDVPEGDYLAGSIKQPGRNSEVRCQRTGGEVLERRYLELGGHLGLGAGRHALHAAKTRTMEEKILINLRRKQRPLAELVTRQSSQRKIAREMNRRCKRELSCLTIQLKQLNRNLRGIRSTMLDFCRSSKP